jgi:hypothetical protein
MPYINSSKQKQYLRTWWQRNRGLQALYSQRQRIKSLHLIEARRERREQCREQTRLTAIARADLKQRQRVEELALKAQHLCKPSELVGVRYTKSEDYAALTSEQKRLLSKWRRGRKRALHHTPSDMPNIIASKLSCERTYGAESFALSNAPFSRRANAGEPCNC